MYIRSALFVFFFVWTSCSYGQALHTKQYWQEVVWNSDKVRVVASSEREGVLTYTVRPTEGAFSAVFLYHFNPATEQITYLEGEAFGAALPDFARFVAQWKGYTPTGVRTYPHGDVYVLETEGTEVGYVYLRSRLTVFHTHPPAEVLQGDFTWRTL